jgi:hypothetical protein
MLADLLWLLFRTCFSKDGDEDIDDAGEGIVMHLSLLLVFLSVQVESIKLGTPKLHRFESYDRVEVEWCFRSP